jgi:hypothetical protein
MRGRLLRHIGLDLGGASAAASVIYDNCRLEMVSHLSPNAPQAAPTEFRGYTRFGKFGNPKSKVVGSGFQLLTRRPALIPNDAPSPGFKSLLGWIPSDINPPNLLRQTLDDGSSEVQITWQVGAHSNNDHHNVILMNGMMLEVGSYAAVSLSIRASVPGRRVRFTLATLGESGLCKAVGFADKKVSHILLVGRNDDSKPTKFSLIVSAPDLQNEGYTLHLSSPQVRLGSLTEIQPVLHGGFNNNPIT